MKYDKPNSTTESQTDSNRMAIICAGAIVWKKEKLFSSQSHFI